MMAKGKKEKSAKFQGFDRREKKKKKGRTGNRVSAAILNKADLFKNDQRGY